jgi:hypothetical protein
MSHTFGYDVGGPLAQVLNAVAAEPGLTAFLAVLIFGSLCTALALYRKHRFSFRRARSPAGSVTTSVSVEPIEYPPIGGFVDAQVVTEWPTRGLDDGSTKHQKVIEARQNSK